MICRVLPLIVVLTGSAAPAQGPAPNPFGKPDRSTTAHLTMSSTISSTAAAPGDRVRVTVEVAPRPTIHVYAPGKHDYQVVQLAIDAQPWLRLEPVKYPPSERYHFEPLNETVEVYSSPFRLSREMTLLSTPEAAKALAGRSSVTITGALQYQACDDKVCYAPAKVPITFQLTVKR